MKKFTTTFLFVLLLMQINYSQSQFNNFEGFSNLDVVIDSTSTFLWQIGEPSKTNFTNPFSAPNVIMTDLVNAYPIGQTTSFEVSFEEELVNYNWPYMQLEWYYQLDAEAGVDGGIIEVSYDDGQTYRNIFSDPDFLPEMVGNFQIDTLFNGQVGITGVSDWQWMAICWGNWIGELPEVTGQLKTRFTFISDDNDTQQDGWMIDDFNVQVAIVGSTTDQNIQPIKVYPNPTTNALYLDLSEFNQTNLSTELYIHDNTGRLIRTQVLNNSNDGASFVSTKNLPTGRYMISFQSADTIFRTSFVKM